MRIGSLFSGIGGLELGLEWAGVGHTDWQVERDPYCQRVLAKHWPDAIRYDDVCTVGAHNLAPVDVICGGFPCQDISYAGKGAGLAGERSGLWYEYARIVGEMGPRYVVVENVAALLTRGLDAVLGALADLGYDAEWDVLSAGGLGAHHIRRRVFVIANLPHAVRCRPQRERTAAKGPWSREQLARLVQTAVRLSVPAGSSGGVSDGVPNRAHRLRALGNAVVPQCAEVVGRRLLAIDAALRQEGAA